MKLKKVFILPLIALSMCTLSACGNNGGGDDDYGISDDSYWGVEKGDFGSSLQIKLHESLLQKHTKYILYSDFDKYVEGTKGYDSIDQDTDNPSKIKWFYTGKSVVPALTGTREHVWACANSAGLWVHKNTPGIVVDEPGYKGGGSDLFHVRPCQGAINTVRGNAKVYEFQQGDTFVESTDGGPYILKTDEGGEYATKYEPADQYKGDVVRILMYVYIHYGGLGTQNSYTGALSLKNVFNSSYGLDDIYRLMVKWNELDPVDEHERHRNQTIEKIQGNRNPFIDHPEYMKACFAIED